MIQGSSLSREMYKVNRNDAIELISTLAHTNKVFFLVQYPTSFP